MMESFVQRPSRKNWNATPNEEGVKGKNGKEKPERFDNTRKIFVKNFPFDEDFNYPAVMEHFITCGEIVHKSFVKKVLAGQELLQGFLVFSTEEEAEKASKLTGTLIGGRHLIVSKYHQFAQPSPNMVVVSNLSNDTDEEDIWQFFEECGPISYIHIDRLLNYGSSHAEVHFKLNKSVRKALKLNGQSLKGNDVNVVLEQNEQESKEFPVYVSGLPHNVQKADLVGFFDGCGPIKRVKIKSKQGEGGHAVVFFKDSESAANAVACNENSMDGNVLSVTQREEGILHQQFVNPVYLANLSRDTKDVDIFLKFQDCGLIKDIKFVQSKHGSLKKAYIEFKDYESVGKALAMVDLELKGEKLIIGKNRDVWSCTKLETVPKFTGKKRKNHQEDAKSSIQSSSEGEKIRKKRKKGAEA